MSVLKKLNKKEAVKYQFTLTIESLDHFYPHGTQESSEEPESKDGGEKRKSANRKSIVGKLSFGMAKNAGPLAVECSYSIFWKRGSKRNGRTGFVAYKNLSKNKVAKSSSSRRANRSGSNSSSSSDADAGGRLRINDVFNFNGTMFPAGKNGKFVKKKLKFDLHERLLTDDATSSTGDKIATCELNLADFIESDHEGEVTRTTQLELDYGKGKGVGSLILTIVSSLSDDPITTATSTMSEMGSDDDATDTDMNSSTDRNGRGGPTRAKSAAVSVLETENADLREQISYYKRKVEELEMIQSGKESDSIDLVLELQKERDTLRQRLKLAQIECDQMREERDQASKEARERARMGSIGSKIRGITTKIGLMKQEGDNGSYESVDQGIERLYELEKENLKLKQQVKLLTTDSSQLVGDEKDEDKEKLVKQVSELRKKIATLEIDGTRKRKNSDAGSDPITNFLQEELASFLDKEVMPLLSNAITKNQMEFTYADIAVAQLGICKTFMQHGFLQDNYFFKLIDRIDKRMFGLLMKKNSLESADGFRAKMAISVLEHFIVEVVGEERMKSRSTFQRTRQCADICVLHKATVLKSDEMRRMVCPDLSFEQVKLICHKLGLVKA